MSSEAHEPCAIMGLRFYLGYSNLTSWTCRVCGVIYFLLRGETPVACPLCGVGYTQILMEGRYFTPAELRR